MNYTSCPVDDCCGGTLIADNGMRARCRNCDGRGVVEAPRVTVTHDGPTVFTPALGDAIAINGRAYQTGWDDGIREGERRMLWAIAVGAEWDRARFADLTRDARSDADDCYYSYFRGRCESAYEASVAALRSLAASGDEDASRVLGERGW